VHENIIVVDVGDFFGNRTPRQQKTFSRVVVDYMRTAGYEVAAIGEKEMNYGVDFLLEQVRQGKFDAVCANLHTKTDSSLIFPPYTIKEVAGVKIGFLGLLDDNPRRVGVFEQLENAYASNYVAAANRWLPEVREESDLVVALAHVGLGNARSLAEKVPGFDVILVGHGGDRTAVAEKIGKTILVKSGSNSSSIGTLLLALDDDERIVGFDGSARTLQKEGRTNPKVERYVKNVEKQQAARERLLERRRFRPPTIPGTPQVVKAEGYLGWETCKRCHEAIYERWSNNPHAHAFASLARDDKWNDPQCLPCHTTGYEVEARADSTDVRPEMWNVQCEACHGMGTRHRRDGSMAPVPESVCLRCHARHMVPHEVSDWNYEEALEKVDHGKDPDLD
jgi:hypothetical protein